MKNKHQLTLEFANLEINTNTREVTRNGQPIDLRKKEYELLEFLARNKDRVLNRLTILEYVWDYTTSIKTNTLEVHIAALRKKIDTENSRQIFQTIRGYGYKLCDAADPSLSEFEA
ncbi:MAG: winged helix-turn-helix domain-containing protein [Candidatus Gracilibacteria bacterium]|nr:winged helix-turn-helix transcriptional regulator [Candidatus Peregrinibacteria bacterium]